MGNFDFVRQTLPSVHDDCARAESYLATTKLPRRRPEIEVSWSHQGWLSRRRTALNYLDRASIDAGQCGIPQTSGPQPNTLVFSDRNKPISLQPALAIGC
jgi:hypothetical protein